MRILSRGSDLAVLQAELVAEAIRAREPAKQVSLAVRSTAGDRNRRVDLRDASDKGLFTRDLSEALLRGEADAVVHSWKDLPLANLPGTIVAGTLERADPRDVLLVRRDTVSARPSALTVLSSSPRRAWQMQQSLGPLLPWPCASVEARPVRGNVPTRLQKLVAGEADGLIVAKAALDRLLAPGSDVARGVRHCLDQCRWMVLPIRRFPTAPAQGALAIEVAAHRDDVIALVQTISHEPTRLSVEAERALLASYGGGCQEAIGATVLLRDFGRVTSIRGALPSGDVLSEWSLGRSSGTTPPRTDVSHIYPRPGERRRTTRRDLPVAVPNDATALWVARAHALPDAHRPADSTLVWTAGLQTWEKLAARGVWVHGSSEGLGEQEAAGVDKLASRAPEWLRLTHDRSDAPGALATYHVDYALPDDLASRTHFFWLSGSLFREAIDRHPGIRAGWHASGPGRTAQALRQALGPDAGVSTWLEYDEWLLNVAR